MKMATSPWWALMSGSRTSPMARLAGASLSLAIETVAMSKASAQDTAAATRTFGRRCFSMVV